MTARRLLNVVHTMLIETLGAERAAELLEPVDPADELVARREQLRSLGVEVG